MIYFYEFFVNFSNVKLLWKVIKMDTKMNWSTCNTIFFDKLILKMHANYFYDVLSVNFQLVCFTNTIGKCDNI